MSNNKLERCPFCGKRDSVVLVENKDYDQYYVLCDPDREPSGCGAETAVFITAKDAIDAWNRRAPIRVSKPSRWMKVDPSSLSPQQMCPNCGDEIVILDSIRLLCKQHRISIARLEHEVGLGNATIRGWEKSSPRVESLKKVADYFGVTVDSLLSTQEADES